MRNGKTDGGFLVFVELLSKNAGRPEVGGDFLPFCSVCKCCCPRRDAHLKSHRRALRRPAFRKC